MLISRYEQVKILYNDRLEISGMPANQLGVRLVKNNLNLAAVISFIKTENKVYILTGMASNEGFNEFFKYKGLFEQLSSTFKMNN